MQKQVGFKIFVDQLRGGHVEKINEQFSPEFLDVHEKELSFEQPVYVKGEAYNAESNLILHLEVSTQATIPCAICNEDVLVPIKVLNMYHTEPLSEIKSGVFSMEQVIREAILLDTPTFAECEGETGKCPKRKEVDKYIRKPAATAKETKGYHPFENLEHIKD